MDAARSASVASCHASDAARTASDRAESQRPSDSSDGVLAGVGSSSSCAASRCSGSSASADSAATRATCSHSTEEDEIKYDCRNEGIAPWPRFANDNTARLAKPSSS